MSNKNNLSAFKRPPAKSILQGAETQAVSAPSTTSKTPKPDSERLTKRAQIMFTETEFATLTEKRGAIPLSAYLRMKLKEMGEV